MKRLTEKEEAFLIQALDILEKQFDKELEACADMIDYDDDFVDIQVTLDNEYEQLKLDRSCLDGSMSPFEIASEIN